MTHSLFLHSNSLLLFAHFVAIIVFVLAQSLVVIYGVFLSANSTAREKLRLLHASFLTQGVCLLFLLVTAVVLCYGQNYEPMGEMLQTSNIVIAAFIVINLGYMVFKLNEAKREFLRGEAMWLKENFVLIVYYFTPLNLILTLIAAYIGLRMRLFH